MLGQLLTDKHLQWVISEVLSQPPKSSRSLEVDDVTPGEWTEFDLDLQPTIYKLLEKEFNLFSPGPFYTTDFGIVRDQTTKLTFIDLAQSSFHLLLEMTEVH